MEGKYYNRVIDAWFLAYEAVGRKPELIKKMHLLNEGGLRHHGQFDRHFPTLEDFYRMNRTHFHQKMQNVIHGYHHGATGAKLWSIFYGEVYNCKKECRIAVYRNDIAFIEEAVNTLQEFLEISAFEARHDSLLYNCCFFSLLGLIWGFIKEWNGSDYEKSYIEAYAQVTARLAFSFNHNTSTFRSILKHLS